MKIYTLKKIQTFPITLKKCWDFFSNPANLELITPAELGLAVISELPDIIYPGMIIHYNVSPILGIKQTWVTEITHIIKPEYFVDEQKIGSYIFGTISTILKKLKMT